MTPVISTDTRRDSATQTLKRHASVLAIAAATIVALGAVEERSYARDDAASSGAERDVVVVTSRFREEDVQSTPIAITAITGEDLDLRSITNVEDLGAVVPNAFFRENVGNFGPTSTIGLRGITQQDFAYSFDPAVALYVDDVYHGTLSGSDMDLLDLARVEVLRGPQGTLFGKNSIGGAIRLISRQPEGDNSGMVEATYGEFDRIDIKGVADFAITDNLFARVSGVSKRRGGYGQSLDFTCDMIRRGTPELAGIGDGLGADGSAGGGLDGQPDMVAVGSDADNSFSLPTSLDPRGGCVITELGGRESDAARALFRLVASSDLEFGFSIDALNSSADPLPQPLLTPQGGGTPPPVAMDDPPAGGNVGYDLLAIFPAYGVRFTGDDRFVSPDNYTNYSSYADPLEGQRYNPTTRTDAWGTSATMDYDIGESMNLKLIGAYRTYEMKWASDTDFTPFPVQGTDYIQEHEQTQFEARLSGVSLSDRFEWTAGYFYYDSESRAYNTTEFGAFDFFGTLVNFVADDRYTTETQSAFVHGIFDITEQLSVSGGVRYTDEKKTNVFDHQPGLLPRIEGDFAGEQTDWKISVDFQATDDVFVYAQAATGFRSAGFTPRIFTAGQFDSIDPEEATTYEVGAKLDLLGNTLRINSAIYYTEYDPRLILQFGVVSQCDSPADPDPFPYMLAGGVCPAGTFFEGAGGLPWFFYGNVPGTLQGFETEGNWNPTDQLSVNFGFGWNEYEGDDRHPTALLQPEWNANAGVQYEIPLGANRSLTPRLDWSYQSHGTNGPAASENVCPEQCVPEYNIFNARVTLDDFDDDWSISIGATNLFDEFYWQSLGAAVSAFGGPVNARTGVPGRPREWFITATKRF